ncbi:TetR/AcrR family transcriptional regulator [Geomonas nitrogeniifigens]|uniref:TetR/AcrR family transcriptional regulator n=1 Tax=Geomonas diazotrophica TaxID=2843197 RepID=A0ABX8JJN6_9BACT|nr:TetR/AcrR family transcriptional regulator [Geomonas nitrogeniifigens]QWV97829.1 TetR/AcrR family transcriptional regulator [Geomonas nitrogeniifigens]QXE86969.1 TetR/AcrR family transcriptional regulator [Geomonas nitrogeniifigens]
MTTIETENPAGRQSGRRAKRSEETRERIFRAALNLFAEKGFNATTIEAITAAADVGKGTFFNYFDNKESVLLEYRELQMARVADFVAAHRDSDRPLAPLLLQLALTLTMEQEKGPGLIQSLMTAVFGSETVQKRMAEAMEGNIRQLSALMARRQQSGEIRSDLDAFSVAQSFQRIIFGTMITWSLSPIDPLEENLKKSIQIFVDGARSK